MQLPTCTNGIGRLLHRRPLPSGPSQIPYRSGILVVERVVSSPPPNAKGRLYTIAAMILMTFMYQARTACYDVQKGINFMAKRISCWDMSVDYHLHNLVCYLNWSKDRTQIGWIGDPAKTLKAMLYLDADFAGCPYTLKSSSGCRFDIQGPNSCFPLSAVRQDIRQLLRAVPQQKHVQWHPGFALRAIQQLLCYHWC